MEKQQLTGLSLIVIIIFFLSLYSYLLLVSEYAEIIIKVTMLFAVVIVCLVIGWIGYTMTIATKENNENTN
jgi:hypothetical protein